MSQEADGKKVWDASNPWVGDGGAGADLDGQALEDWDCGNAEEEELVLIDEDEEEGEGLLGHSGQDEATAFGGPQGVDASGGAVSPSQLLSMLNPTATRSPSIGVPQAASQDMQDLLNLMSGGDTPTMGSGPTATSGGIQAVARGGLGLQEPAGALMMHQLLGRIKAAEGGPTSPLPDPLGNGDDDPEYQAFLQAGGGFGAVAGSGGADSLNSGASATAGSVGEGLATAFNEVLGGARGDSSFLSDPVEEDDPHASYVPSPMQDIFGSTTGLLAECREKQQEQQERQQQRMAATHQNKVNTGLEPGESLFSTDGDAKVEAAWGAATQKLSEGSVLNKSSSSTTTAAAAIGKGATLLLTEAQQLQVSMMQQQTFAVTEEEDGDGKQREDIAEERSVAAVCSTFDGTTGSAEIQVYEHFGGNPQPSCKSVNAQTTASLIDGHLPFLARRAQRLGSRKDLPRFSRVRVFEQNLRMQALHEALLDQEVAPISEFYSNRSAAAELGVVDLVDHGNRLPKPVAQESTLPKVRATFDNADQAAEGPFAELHHTTVARGDDDEADGHGGRTTATIMRVSSEEKEKHLTGFSRPSWWRGVETEERLPTCRSDIYPQRRVPPPLPLSEAGSLRSEGANVSWTRFNEGSSGSLAAGSAKAQLCLLAMKDGFKAHNGDNNQTFVGQTARYVPMVGDLVGEPKNPEGLPMTRNPVEEAECGYYSRRGSISMSPPYKPTNSMLHSLPTKGGASRVERPLPGHFGMCRQVHTRLLSENRVRFNGPGIDAEGHQEIEDNDGTDEEDDYIPRRRVMMVVKKDGESAAIPDTPTSASAAASTSPREDDTIKGSTTAEEGGSYTPATGNNNDGDDGGNQDGDRSSSSSAQAPLVGSSHGPADGGAASSSTMLMEETNKLLASLVPVVGVNQTSSGQLPHVPFSTFEDSEGRVPWERKRFTWGMARGSKEVLTVVHRSREAQYFNCQAVGLFSVNDLIITVCPEDQSFRLGRVVRVEKISNLLDEVKAKHVAGIAIECVEKDRPDEYKKQWRERFKACSRLQDSILQWLQNDLKDDTPGIIPPTQPSKMAFFEVEIDLSMKTFCIFCIVNNQKFRSLMDVVSSRFGGNVTGGVKVWFIAFDALGPPDKYDHGDGKVHPDFIPRLSPEERMHIFRLPPSSFPRDPRGDGGAKAGNFYSTASPAPPRHVSNKAISDAQLARVHNPCLTEMRSLLGIGHKAFCYRYTTPGASNPMYHTDTELRNMVKTHLEKSKTAVNEKTIDDLHRRFAHGKVAALALTSAQAFLQNSANSGLTGAQQAEQIQSHVQMLQQQEADFDHKTLVNMYAAYGLDATGGLYGHDGVYYPGTTQQQWVTAAASRQVGDVADSSSSSLSTGGGGGAMTKISADATPFQPSWMKKSTPPPADGIGSGTASSGELPQEHHPQAQSPTGPGGSDYLSLINYATATAPITYQGGKRPETAPALSSFGGGSAGQSQSTVTPSGVTVVMVAAATPLDGSSYAAGAVSPTIAAPGTNMSAQAWQPPVSTQSNGVDTPTSATIPPGVSPTSAAPAPTTTVPGAAPTTGGTITTQQTDKKLKAMIAATGCLLQLPHQPASLALFTPAMLLILSVGQINKLKQFQRSFHEATVRGTCPTTTAAQRDEDRLEIWSVDAGVQALYSELSHKVTTAEGQALLARQLQTGLTLMKAATSTSTPTTPETAGGEGTTPGGVSAQLNTPIHSQWNNVEGSQQITVQSPPVGGVFAGGDGITRTGDAAPLSVAAITSQPATGAVSTETATATAGGTQSRSPNQGVQSSSPSYTTPSVIQLPEKLYHRVPGCTSMLQLPFNDRERPTVKEYFDQVLPMDLLLEEEPFLTQRMWCNKMVSLVTPTDIIGLGLPPTPEFWTAIKELAPNMVLSRPRQYHPAQVKLVIEKTLPRTLLPLVDKSATGAFDKLDMDPEELKVASWEMVPLVLLHLAEMRRQVLGSLTDESDPTSNPVERKPHPLQGISLAIVRLQHLLMEYNELGAEFGDSKISGEPCPMHSGVEINSSLYKRVITGYFKGHFHIWLTAVGLRSVDLGHAKPPFYVFHYGSDDILNGDLSDSHSPNETLVSICPRLETLEADCTLMKTYYKLYVGALEQLYYWYEAQTAKWTMKYMKLSDKKRALTLGSHDEHGNPVPPTTSASVDHALRTWSEKNPSSVDDNGHRFSTEMSEEEEQSHFISGIDSLVDNMIQTCPLTILPVSERLLSLTSYLSKSQLKKVLRTAHKILGSHSVRTGLPIPLPASVVAANAAALTATAASKARAAEFVNKAAKKKPSTSTQKKRFRPG